LFYRLNVISLRLPSLRERPADVQKFAANYLAFFARQCGKEVTGFSHGAAKAIQDYRWPGNLRELRMWWTRGHSRFVQTD